MSLEDKDRRWYERIDIDVPCNVYFDNVEYTGVVKDISENGMSFIFDAKYNETDLNVRLKSVKSVEFNMTDRFSIYNDGNERIAVVVGSARLIRDGENPYMIGCSFINPSNDLVNYVIDKKIACMLSVGGAR